MPDEQPITREMAEQAMRIFEDAFNSGQDEVHVSIWGMTVGIRKHAEGWFTAEAPGQSTDQRIFNRSAERPRGYPESVPFVPNEIASVTMGRTTMLSWLAPTNPDEVFASAVHQTAQDAWVEDPRESRPPNGGTLRSFKKDGNVRSVSISPEGLVWLMQLEGDN